MSNLNDLLKIMREHQNADRLVQGALLRNADDEGVYRGCFYGCAMQSRENPIEAACEKYGLPLWIGYWSEKVFEGLPVDEAKAWPVQLLEALIAYNGDYEDLRHNLAIKRLTYLSERNTGGVKKAIEFVIEYHKSRDEVSRKAAAKAAWSVAESAALSAAAAAAWSAESSAAAAAAWSAESSASAAWSAAAAAAWSAESSASAASSAAWQRERYWMLELLKKGK